LEWKYDREKMLSTLRELAPVAGALTCVGKSTLNQCLDSVHQEMKEAVTRSYYLAIILSPEKEGITLLSHHVLIQKVRCLDTDISYPF
jgi:hypothetical protein